MENSVSKISKALLDLSRVADEVLYPTRKGSGAANDKELSHGQRSLLERIDGFRSLEQVLAMSGDVIGAHAGLGKLLALGYVTCDPAMVNAQPAPSMAPAVPAKPQKAAVATPAPTAPRAPAPAPAPAAASVKSKTAPVAPAKTPAAPAANTEVESAKRLLLLEAKMALGAGAAKLVPHVQACTSIEQVYDLIVKFQQHLAQTGKADPDVFLDRLSKGLATVRSRTGSAKPAPRAAAK